MKNLTDLRKMVEIGVAEPDYVQNFISTTRKG